MALGHDSQISTLSLRTTALSIDFFLFTFSSSCILKGLNLTYTEPPTSVKCFLMKARTGQYWSYHYIYNHCYLSFIQHASINWLPYYNNSFIQNLLADFTSQILGTDMLQITKNLLLVPYIYVLPWRLYTFHSLCIPMFPHEKRHTRNSQ